MTDTVEKARETREDRQKDEKVGERKGSGDVRERRRKERHGGESMGDKS